MMNRETVSCLFFISKFLQDDSYKYRNVGRARVAEAVKVFFLRTRA